jgi:hypothetical protein
MADPSRTTFTMIDRPQELAKISTSGEVEWAPNASPEAIMQHPALTERIAILALWYATHRD